MATAMDGSGLPRELAQELRKLPDAIADALKRGPMGSAIAAIEKVLAKNSPGEEGESGGGRFDPSETFRSRQRPTPYDAGQRLLRAGAPAIPALGTLATRIAQIKEFADALKGFGESLRGPKLTAEAATRRTPPSLPAPVREHNRLRTPGQLPAAADLGLQPLGPLGRPPAPPWRQHEWQEWHRKNRAALSFPVTGGQSSPPIGPPALPPLPADRRRLPGPGQLPATDDLKLRPLLGGGGSGGGGEELRDFADTVDVLAKAADKLERAAEKLGHTGGPPIPSKGKGLPPLPSGTKKEDPQTQDNFFARACALAGKLL